MAKTAKPVVFLKEVRLELEKVSWPTRKEAIRLTSIVILISALVGIFIGAFDYVFTKIMQIVITR